MAGMKGVSDDDIARWIFEDSEVEGEFSDEIVFMFFSFKTVG
jgi:hypothetical protein